MPWKIDYIEPTKRYVKMKLCAYGTWGARKYLYQLGVPYILSSFKMRDDRLVITLSGGRGDVVSAVFHKDYDKTTRDLILGFIKQCDPACLVPLVDRLIEDEHWISSLLSKWVKCANKPNEWGLTDLTEKIWKSKPIPKFDDLLSV